MGIRVVWMDLQGCQVVGESPRSISDLIEEVSKVKMRERVVRIDVQGFAVLAFRFAELACVEVYRPKIHQRAGGGRIDFGRLAIGSDDVFNGCTGMLQLQSFLEPA